MRMIAILGILVLIIIFVKGIMISLPWILLSLLGSAVILSLFLLIVHKPYEEQTTSNKFTFEPSEEPEIQGGQYIYFFEPSDEDEDEDEVDDWEDPWEEDEDEVDDWEEDEDDYLTYPDDEEED